VWVFVAALAHLIEMLLSCISSFFKWLGGAKGGAVASFCASPNPLWILEKGQKGNMNLFQVASAVGSGGSSGPA